MSKNKLIQYDRDKFFTRKPVTVDGIGEFRFLSYIEYLDNISFLSMMKMNVLHIYHQYRKMFDEKDKEAMAQLDSLKEEKLVDIVRSQKEFLESYVTILKLVLDENDKNNTWDIKLKDDLAKSIMKEYALRGEFLDEGNAKKLITPDMLLMKALENIITNEEMFYSVRELIMDMQMLVEDLVNPNPEIQAGIEAKREMDAEEKDGVAPLDIVSTIVAGTANSFEEVCNMTVIQLNATFARIGAFKSYDANMLFMSAGHAIKNVGSWSQSIDLYKKEEQGIKKKDFDKKFGGLLG